MVEQKYGIKIITHPSIALIAKTQFIGMPEDVDERWVTERADGFGSSSGDIDDNLSFLLEAAGRSCYQSWHNPANKTNAEYLANIISMGHGSVLEHASYSFYCRGLSRSLTHELVRHRVGVGISQLSQRFVDSSDIAFVLPPAWIGNEDLIEPWAKQCMQSLKSYQYLLQEIDKDNSLSNAKIKQKREAARAVLPNCAETHMVWTCNIRALRHVLEMRGSLHADAEIRRFALELYHLVSKETCMLMDFEAKIDGDLEYIERVDITPILETLKNKRPS